MFTTVAAKSWLEAAMKSSEDVYVGAGKDRAAHCDRLANDIWANIREPFLVEAAVMEPGFPFASVGERVAGYCIAEGDGKWLVQQAACAGR